MTDAARRAPSESLLGRARRWRYHSAVHVALALNRLAGEPRHQVQEADSAGLQRGWSDALFERPDR